MISKFGIAVLLLSSGFIKGQQDADTNQGLEAATLERREKSVSSSMSSSKTSKKSSRKEPSSAQDGTSNGTPGILMYANSPTFDIIACSENEVIVQGTDATSLDIGNYIIVPATDKSVCSSCAPLFRKISGMQEGEIDGRLAITFTTEFATFKEIVPVASIQEEAYDSEIEPNFECSHSLPPGSRQRRTAEERLHVDMHRALQVQTCENWKAKDSNGECIHTNCHVGDADPALCFSCNADGGNCNNGCGPAWSPVSFDGNGIWYDFGEACCSHDYCYSAYDAYSKTECDDFFFSNMMEECDRRYPLGKLSFFQQISLPFKEAVKAAIEDIGHDSCWIDANLFFSVVRDFGSGAYSDAVNSQTDYEKRDFCAEQCPSTRRSGGRGTHRFRVDMLRSEGTFQVSYNMYANPDQLTIEHEGQVLFTTVDLVSGSRTFDLTFAGSDGIIDVLVTAPNAGTEWDVFIGCPE